ncbi:unnamed protein product [Withania somnifera]
MATNIPNSSPLFFIIVLIIYLSLPQHSNAEQQKTNDNNFSIYYMCRDFDTINTLTKLGPGDNYKFNISQIAFPMRWCYLYINPRTHGFFWAYNVRSKCTRCFWSVTNFPYLYKADRVRWEREKLFTPVGFNINDYLVRNI